MPTLHDPMGSQPVSKWGGMYSTVLLPLRNTSTVLCYLPLRNTSTVLCYLPLRNTSTCTVLCYLPLRNTSTSTGT